MFRDIYKYQLVAKSVCRVLICKFHYVYIHPCTIIGIAGNKMYDSSGIEAWEKRDCPLQMLNMLSKIYSDIQRGLHVNVIKNSSDLN